MKTPCRQSRDSYTSGTVVARRPPNSTAEIGTPFGSSHSSAITGHCDAGAQKRELGWVAGRRFRLRGPVLAAPVGGVRRGLAVHAFPPHVAVVGERDVGEHGVVG